MNSILWLIFSLQIWPSLTSPLDYVEAALGIPVTTGTFQNPSNSVRPKFRYWIPDGSINTTYLNADIVALAERGAGGIQFLNYFFYGGTSGTPPPEVNYSTYGFGTPAYLDVLKSALQTTKANGLVMDFCMGPQSGQGVPADPQEIGLTWEMVSYNITLNASYDGQIPGWGEGDFISAVTYELEDVNVVQQYYLVYGAPSNKTQYRFKWQSLTDVTSQVSNNGHITLGAASLNGTQPNTLFASYARRSYTRACIASSDNPQNILQNGSFAVDHFSTAGAQLTTSFLEGYILVNGIKELFMEVGKYIWEDSVEIHVPNFWTPGLENIFEHRNGYSMKKYLPLLWGYSGDLAVGIPDTQIVSDSPSNDYNFLADLRSTMTDQYALYLNYLVNWTHSTLGLDFSAQVGYNLPLDMLQNIPLVDVPETESLSFGDNIDAYRQYTGPADLAGKNIISIEVGADFLSSYSQTLSGLLAEIKRSLVAGVNQLVLHGATYSYPYPNTTWPGFTSFSYLFAGQHSRHQPAWNVGYRESVNWMARSLWVLQTGVTKVDLVFWDKQLMQNPYPNTSYIPSDLADAGYSYQYLTAENLDLPTAQVSQRLLAPTRQGFKAFIIRGNDTLTVRGVNRLVNIANSGFPIFISGGIPTRYAASNITGISVANTQLQSILNLTNVYQISAGPVANAIRSAGILPRTKISSNATWYTRWREDQNGDIYVFVYNDGNSSTGNVAFATTSKPAMLNAWTGEEAVVVLYSIADGYTTIPLSLAAKQAVIYKFSNVSTAQRPSTYITSVSNSGIEISYSNTSNTISAKVPKTAQQIGIALSNGTIISLPPTTLVSSAYTLTNWSLTVEKWQAPSNLYDVIVDANKTNITLPLPGPTLPPWSSIQSLTNTSGIGYYTVYFNWSSANQNTSTQTGALLSIPPVDQGLQGMLNGQHLPTLDITNPQVDITQYLVDGSNQLTLIVSTTLYNVLSPIWYQLYTGGNGVQVLPPGLVAGGGPQLPYGIIGTVTITPYELVRILE